MKRIGLRVNKALKPENKLDFGQSTVGWDSIQKAFKYIRRWIGKNGKWQYLYPDDLMHPVKAVKRLFGLEEKKVITEYESHHIKKEYGADKKTFTAHILEYLSNKLKWDKIFNEKENRAKYDKPVKQKDVAAAAAVEKLNDDGSPSLFKEKTKSANIINRSLMKKVWEIYNPQKNLDAAGETAENIEGGNENGGKDKDSAGTGSRELPAGTPAVRAGGGEGSGDLDVHSGGAGSEQGESGGPSNQSGGIAGGSVRGRRRRSAIKDIREQVKKLLAEKKDGEFTEADKELLRQYEGGGGLAEKDATTHGTLYEFYTPKKVVDKVWELVDKYNPRPDKKVIEPSAGTGRFAENRLEKFDLFELDETSARIAGILHPDANVKQGYFQELFMNGRIPKKAYDGKKYDVAIGNPPYGEYSGLHRGLGEGKEHSRIEEYFIDRSLDTLQDGGILAMVVPSGFLRGKNSKAKQAIAKKAKLLEAWRLPNGTFGTTGIGTDIIVLRKEPGDLIDFQNDIYFQTNPDNIAGVECEKMGRFGMEKYVSPPDGMGFDEALDSINPNKVPVIATGEKSPVTTAIETTEAKVTDAEEHQNRSEAMRGNKNAYKGGPQEVIDHIYTMFGMTGDKLWAKEFYEYALRFKSGEDYVKYIVANYPSEKNSKKKHKQLWDYVSASQEQENRSQAMQGNDNAAGSRGGENAEPKGRKKNTDADTYTLSIGKNMTAEEYNKKYGISVDPRDIGIWKETDGTGKINPKNLSITERKYMESCGNYTVDGSGNWYNVINYAAGNIYERLDELEREKDELIKKYGEKQYKINKSILEAAMLPPKKAENIHFSPIDDFVKTYRFEGENGAEYDLIKAFKSWAQVRTYGFGKRASESWSEDDSPISQYEIPPNITFHDVMAYINQESVRADRATARDTDSETARIETAKKRECRRECAERLFNRFIREGLPEDQREKLVDTWNRRFNAVVNPDFSKIPVVINGMNTHKGEKKFDLIPEQVEGISFSLNKGNGILAHDVGVGKLNPLSEPVLTPIGWKTIGDLKEGDYVIAVDGTPTKVIKIYPQGILDIYTVKFSDGSTSRCGYEHLWDIQYPFQRSKGQCYGNKANEWKTLTTREIHEDMKKSCRGNRKYTIPMCEPVQFEKRHLLIPAYAMGYLLGNGWFSKNYIAVTIPDEFVKEKIKALLPQNGFIKGINSPHPMDYYIRGVDDWRRALKEQGLIGKHSFDKFLPEEYKFAAVEDRIELLRGLMDSDGTVAGCGNTPIFYTTSKELSEDVKELVQSLGGTVTVRKKQGKYKKDDETVVCRLCYCITMRLKAGINPFSLPRKADKYTKRTKYFPVRFIEKIEYSHKEESACIYVEHPRHLFITNDYLVTHNTVQGESISVGMLQNGARRGVNLVPKAVYKKWKKEYKQHYPDVQILDLHNLSKDKIEPYLDKNGKINLPENTIALMTEEALQRITFKDETLDSDLVDDITDSQTVYDSETEDKRTPKEKAEEREAMKKELGMGIGAKEGAVYWEDLGFDFIVVDECFPYDTPVLTENGWMKIGDIVDGRKEIRVYSCNYEQNLIELKPITAWMPKRLEHKIVKVNLSNGESLTCTHNHKIWTENGYVRAENVEGQDVFVLRKNVRNMREGILLQILRGEVQPKETLLFMPLRGNISEQSAAYQGSDQNTGLSLAGEFDKRKEDALPLGADETKQPDVEPGYKGKGSIKESREAVCGGTWGEREIYRAANSFDGVTKSAPRVCNSNEGNDNAECSAQLQSGFGDCKQTGCYRNRRACPQIQNSAGERCEENSVFERARVESVEILERGSFEQYGFRSEDDTTVYDIEVADNHNFIASGVLVSNCHREKNVFGKVRNLGKGRGDDGNEANEFGKLAGVNPSKRARKLFLISQLIQKQNDGRGFFGLSATPFVNSPIEVYNMLSLVARKKLKEIGLFNMHAFLAEFAEVHSEWTVDKSGEVVQKEVMKKWKNLGALQNLLSQHFHRVDAEEAGIIRPRKKLHLPELEMTPLQRAIIQAETHYMENADPKEDPGATLKAINNMRTATLSPAAIKPERLEFYKTEYAPLFEGIEMPEKEDFVKASPKLTFTCESVAANYKKMPDSGQIIYIPRGVDDFIQVKKYLVEKGMPEGSIEFIHGKTDEDERERIRNDFNDPNGRCKVIIGSEAIKEGISLNGKSHALYNCMLGWNPTETTQVEGRLWRQGNKQGHVHIVYPLMADSIDSFMYQKYDEKKSRIDEIWSYDGDVSNDVSDINPEELKFDLIKDPKKKAKMIVGQREEAVKQDIRMAEMRYDVLSKDRINYERAERNLPDYQKDHDRAESNVKAAREKRDRMQKELDKAKKDGRGVDIAQVNFEHAKYELEQDNSTLRNERKYLKELKDDIEMYEAKFRKLGIKPAMIESKLKEYSGEIQRLQKEQQKILESFNFEVEKAQKELAKNKKKIPPLKAMIEENITSIMGDLRPMDDDLRAEIKAEAEARRGLNKSLVILDNRLYLKVK